MVSIIEVLRLKQAKYVPEAEPLTADSTREEIIAHYEPALTSYAKRRGWPRHDATLKRIESSLFQTIKEIAVQNYSEDVAMVAAIVRAVYHPGASYVFNDGGRLGVENLQRLVEGETREATDWALEFYGRGDDAQSRADRIEAYNLFVPKINERYASSVVATLNPKPTWER